MTGCSVFEKQINRNANTHAYISIEDRQHDESKRGRAFQMRLDRLIDCPICYTQTHTYSVTSRLHESCLWNNPALPLITVLINLLSGAC